MKPPQLEPWSQRRTGMMVSGLVELGLVVLFASLAVNSGSLWQWTLALILLFAATGNIIHIIKPHKK